MRLTLLLLPLIFLAGCKEEKPTEQPAVRVETIEQLVQKCNAIDGTISEGFSGGIHATGTDAPGLISVTMKFCRDETKIVRFYYSTAQLQSETGK